MNRRYPARPTLLSLPTTSLRRSRPALQTLSWAALSLWLMAACTPTVQVAVPNEPITINLNVRIEHEIRVKVERELDDIFSENSGLF